jgi:hypothetical protein
MAGPARQLRDRPRGRVPAARTVRAALWEMVAAGLAVRHTGGDGEPPRWSATEPPRDASLASLKLRGPHDLRHTFSIWLEDAGSGTEDSGTGSSSRPAQASRSAPNLTAVLPTGAKISDAEPPAVPLTRHDWLLPPDRRGVARVEGALRARSRRPDRGSGISPHRRRAAQPHAPVPRRRTAGSPRPHRRRRAARRWRRLEPTIRRRPARRPMPEVAGYETKRVSRA